MGGWRIDDVVTASRWHLNGHGSTMRIGRWSRWANWRGLCEQGCAVTKRQTLHRR